MWAMSFGVKFLSLPSFCLSESSGLVLQTPLHFLVFPNPGIAEGIAPLSVGVSLAELGAAAPVLV